MWHKIYNAKYLRRVAKIKVKQEGEPNSANSIIAVAVAEKIITDEFAQHLEKMP
jgi:hypothetical protein